MFNVIKIKGAKVHNLKNVDIEIPKNRLVVITGLSGSGKSSLAFDTLYAEGQRRYVESLSSYARQFLASQDKPDVEKIEGLSPAIAIDQRVRTNNPRSTVGTMTEIYDLLRVLYAHFGVPYCPVCGVEVKEQKIDVIAKKIWQMCQTQDILFLAPVVMNKRGQHRQALNKIAEAKYSSVRVDGYICGIEEALDMDLDKTKKHTIELIVDRVKNIKERMQIVDCGQMKGDLNKKSETGELFYRLLETAFDLGDGVVVVYDMSREQDYLFSTHLVCPKCGESFPQLEPSMFSFNLPQGACEFCGGLGKRMEIDEDLIVPNKRLSLEEGAIRPWTRIGSNVQSNHLSELEKVGKKYDFSLDLAIDKFSRRQLDILFYGERQKNGFIGLCNQLLKKYNETNSGYIKEEIEKYMRSRECSVCKGKRLNAKMLSVIVGDKNISELTQLTIDKIIKFFEDIRFDKKQAEATGQLIREIVARLKLLDEVGLNYLTLDRAANTLSGGEMQKVRLATQIGTYLTGVLYVLDEPSIGLHSRDNEKLVATLKKLQHLGNSVIVVEHDEEMIKAADWVIDVGPGAGKHGGEIIYSGDLNGLMNKSQSHPSEEIAKLQNHKSKIINLKELNSLVMGDATKSLTGKYLRRELEIKVPRKGKRMGNGKMIEILGASEFNLKNINVKIPLGEFVCVTGVSGSGKSTLVTDILSRFLAQLFYRAKDIPGKYKEIKGVEYINKVVTIDQSPIGRTPRSNPATYAGLFTYIRELYASQPEARIKGFGAGHFSFNVKGGRCEACHGDGVKRLEMNFLPDMYVECEECHGKRYNEEALEIYWQGKNITDVLELTVEEALDFFRDIDVIREKLKILSEVGLGYIHLGQSATTLSGGEAQRVKLATELSRRATGKTFYILDEPTIGLHFDDVQKLLQVLNRLVDKGNTVLVVEHNLDVIKSADYIIDLGPEGGDRGGEVVVAGTPEEVAKCGRSWTGKFLANVLKKSEKLH